MHRKNSQLYKRNKNIDIKHVRNRALSQNSTGNMMLYLNLSTQDKFFNRYKSAEFLQQSFSSITFGSEDRTKRPSLTGSGYNGAHQGW